MKDTTRFRIDIMKRALRRPDAAGKLLLTRRGWARVRYLLKSPPCGNLDQSQRISARAYRSIDDYRAHQRSKLALVDLDEYDRRLRRELAERLGRDDWKGRSVLCLAARLGGEVRAFHDVGAFAVGIDLNPGPENPVVLLGDFHRLIFPDHCIDAIYCNSMDHALDLKSSLAEVRRVLKLHGILYVDAQLGSEANDFDEWAATSWRSIDDLVEVIVNNGFRLKGRSRIEFPWLGECLQFVKD